MKHMLINQFLFSRQWSKTQLAHSSQSFHTTVEQTFHSKTYGTHIRSFYTLNIYNIY